MTGAEAWAVWNDCQGVFSCSVTHSKKEAEAILEKMKAADCRVVPVRVIVEPEVNHWYREAAEREQERLREHDEPSAPSEPNGMTALLADVRAFHEAAGVLFPAQIEFPDAAEVALNMRMLREEFKEIEEAIEKQSLTELADGIGDLMYFGARFALACGMPLDRVWAEIHRTNMAKIDPVAGVVLRRADGKILKPPTWSPPDIAAALGLPAPTEVA